VLEALEPPGLEATIQAAQAHADAAEAARRHWHQRVERAEYEVGVARRQYDAIDPETRLVARELERRFEKALQGVEAVRQEAEAHIEQLPDALSSEEEARLIELARDLPRLWRGLWPPPLEIRPARRTQAMKSETCRPGIRAPVPTRLWTLTSPTGRGQVRLLSPRGACAGGSTRPPRRSPRAVSRATPKGSSYPSIPYPFSLRKKALDLPKPF
jgi:hypothetical protein